LDGQHEAAIKLYKEGVEQRPQWKPIHIRLAAVYSDLGRYDEAKKEIELYVEAKPEATLGDVMVPMTFKDKARAEWYAELLRKAGMPE
jgi:tetratricopeptide (TPR) repeat protein